MANIVALVDGETALGFSLAGIAGRPTETPEELGRQAESLRADREVRVVLLDGDLFRQLPEKLKRELEDSRSPLYIPVPAFRIRRGALAPEEYVARLMRRAIGYQVKIRG